MNFILPCVASFILTVIVTPLVIHCAKACNCLDVPGGRRLHKVATPRWGGVAFFVGVLPFLFIGNGDGALTSYIVASCLLVGMGVIDDVKSLDWKMKFAGMAAAATTVIFGGDIVVHSLGTYGPLGRIDLGWFSVPFTYIGIIGITNAINLLDGLNGLAGGVSLLGFLFMGIAAALTGNYTLALICFAFVGALGAFLLYNFPNARIFMGDTGSLFLGFSLSLTAVLLTQGSNTSVDSMFPVLVLLLPIFDTLRVLTVRLLNGKNPFRGDNLHLHFLLMEKNISPVYVTFIFWSMTALFGGVALSLTNNTSMSYLTFVLFASLLLGLFAFSLTQRQHIRREARTGSPLPAETGAYSSGLTRHHTFGFGFTRNEEIVRFKWIVTMGVLLLPAQTIGQTDCWYYEYPDHYMAVCDGDEKAGAIPPHSAVTVQPALNPDSQSTGNRSDKSLKSVPSSYSESTTRTPSSAHEAQQQGTRREGFVDASAPQSPGKDIVLTEVKPQANGRKSEVYPSMYRPPRSILNRLQSE